MNRIYQQFTHSTSTCTQVLIAIKDPKTNIVVAEREHKNIIKKSRENSSHRTNSYKIDHIIYQTAKKKRRSNNRHIFEIIHSIPILFLSSFDKYDGLIFGLAPEWWLSYHRKKLVNNVMVRYLSFALGPVYH